MSVLKDNCKHVFNTDQNQFDQVQLDQGQIDQNQSDQILEIRHLVSCQPTFMSTNKIFNLAKLIYNCRSHAKEVQNWGNVSRPIF